MRGNLEEILSREFSERFPRVFREWKRDTMACLIVRLELMPPTEGNMDRRRHC
jgi:hypothetical protein